MLSPRCVSNGVLMLSPRGVRWHFDVFAPGGSNGVLVFLSRYIVIIDMPAAVCEDTDRGTQTTGYKIDMPAVVCEDTDHGTGIWTSFSSNDGR